MRKILVLCAISILAACSSGGPDPQAVETARDRLPDLSGQVEQAGGQDPRKYYIANLKELNAVDLDGDGVWDDVWERLKSSRYVEEVGQASLKQTVRAFQKKTTLRTKVEALENGAFTDALGCLAYRLQQKGVSADASVLQAFDAFDAAKAAFMTSKARVMAATYGDMLTSGARRSLSTGKEADCK